MEHRLNKETMKTLYYINGKQVDINTYYSVSSSDYIRKHIWKSCISYYKTHPSEFEFIARFSNEKDLASSLMEAYERTDEYMEQMKKKGIVNGILSNAFPYL